MAAHSSPDLNIKKIEIWPVDIELTNDFVISKGIISVAKNLFIKICLKNGTVGYGEIAPFTEITGENRETCYQKACALTEHLRGRSVSSYRLLSRLMNKLEPELPAVRCGFETAILDALCRSLGLPLWAFWGGAMKENLTTDITIPIGTREHSLELAQQWYRRGFRTFKVKVGINPEEEVKVVQGIFETFPGVWFIFDANQGFTREEAIMFITRAKSLGLQILVFEQPINKDDLEGMSLIRQETSIPVGADESVTTLQDARRVIKALAADVINLKIMKSGVIETLDIAACASCAGLQLMIGGMVETRLAMGLSLSLAMGLGTIQLIDLDTPLLMKHDPLQGGYGYDGPLLGTWNAPGLGIEPVQTPHEKG